MDTLQSRMRDLQRLRLEADLAAEIEALFKRCPTLCGFSLDAELDLADVVSYPALDAERSEKLCYGIMLALHDLVEERPEALELLRGRTFARCLH